MSLIINNLSKKYDDNWVIKDVSLHVEKGEILGLFGVVAEGKTTVIRLLAGTEKLNSGTIFYNSEDLTERDCDERGFNFPKLTNDAFWEAMFNAPNKSSQLADGEGQVLALEHALENASEVLLLDNQFCFMDRITRERNCEKLRAVVKEKNLAVVFATNDYAEVFSICDRVSVLHNGVIIQTGTPREVFETPKTVAVARVTGRNNLIEAKSLVSSKTGTPEFQTTLGEHRLFTDQVGGTAAVVQERVTLAIRPEHVSISFGASFPEDNLLRAEITGISFLGATTLIKLNAGGLKLEALVLRLVGLKVGEECMVGLPPDRILVLKE